MNGLPKNRLGDAFRECRRIMAEGPPKKRKPRGEAGSPNQAIDSAIESSKAQPCQVLRETPLGRWLNRERRLAGRQP
jgi:hypothetical protein